MRFISAASLPSTIDVGYEVRNSGNGIITPRTDEGVVELYTGDGYSIYAAVIEVADEAAPAFVAWDNANEQTALDVLSQAIDIDLGVLVATTSMPAITGVNRTIYGMELEEISERSTDGIEQVFEGDDYGQYMLTFSPAFDVEYGLIIWDDGEGNAVWDRFKQFGAVGSGSGGGSEEQEPKSIVFAVVKDGEFFSVDALPTLNSPAGNYGLARIDTGELVVAAGAQYSGLGSGLYGYTFFEPAENLRYRYYTRVNVDGVEYIIPANTSRVSSSVLVIGRYTNSYRIGLRYGADNVHLWLSQPLGDNEEPVDYAVRMAQYIKDAEDRVDRSIQGVYVSAPIEDTIPELIAWCATELAGIVMYEARGTSEFNVETGQAVHRLIYDKRNVENVMKQIRRGKLAFDGMLTPANMPVMYAPKVTYPLQTKIRRLSS